MAGNRQRRGAIREEADEIADEELNAHAGRSRKLPDSQTPTFSLQDKAQLLHIHRNDGNLNVYFTSQTIFETLMFNDDQNGILSPMRHTFSKKARLQASRRHQQASDNRSYYKPYANVKNRVIKKRLIFLAGRFNFLDCGFAEYFQSVVPSFDRGYIQQRLKSIREDIRKFQHSNPATVEDPEAVYLGDLGEFFEAVSKKWNYDASQNDPRSWAALRFNSTHQRDREIFAYLQDAFETYYWELMLDIFLHWRTSSKSFSGEIVFKVLESLEREIRNGRNQLLSDIEAQSEDSLENLASIMQGIDKRIAILGSVSDLNDYSLSEMQGLLILPVSPPHDSQPTSPEEPSAAGTSVVRNKEEENVVLIALILIFLIAAVVPGYKLFSISIKTNAPGSVYDADFIDLIQSSLMSVLGNLVMVIPLLKKSLFSPAYATMWMFFTLGLLFAIISVVIYPLTNTGWSSMVAFFSSIASVASVLVMTQDAARDGHQKMKND